MSSLRVGVGRTQSLASGRCRPLGAACLPETSCPEADEEAGIFPLRDGERGEFVCQPLVTGSPHSRAVTRRVAKKRRGQQGHGSPTGRTCETLGLGSLDLP